MERSDPQETDPAGAGDTDAGVAATCEALWRLRQASGAAQRLIADAAAQAAVTAATAATVGREQRKPPAAGWQTPAGGNRPGRDDQAETPNAPDDADLVARSIQALCELIGPELQQRLAQALREVLLAVRALIDGYIERLERHPPEPDEVQDIPIL